ncbi:dihydroneopterin aldolase [Methylopila sp. Yamaguchi]|uniref:dihydroneopterin aldolase n=1 Tax=Methylopila sp. Yamaguchi TaxID=1437817 RepID=UPI000CAB1A71|nr:dihydroneopterin aldolase [Methylopila sp. Yamaguchi]GBD49432.1 dihydroneopterin aldolase [Methylopila sp. Yamaguchi]
MSDRIFLRGVQLHARHGVFEEERRLGQRFIVDVDYWVDTAGYAQTDDFRSAVSYNDVYLTLMEIAAGEPVNLIETLADRIAAALLARFAPIEVVRVQVHKPSAPIAGVFGDVGVDITRRRGEA